MRTLAIKIEFVGAQIGFDSQNDSDDDARRCHEVARMLTDLALRIAASGSIGTSDTFYRQIRDTNGYRVGVCQIEDGP